MGKCKKPFIWSSTLGRCVDTTQKKGRIKKWFEPEGDNTKYDKTVRRQIMNSSTKKKR